MLDSRACTLDVNWRMAMFSPSHLPRERILHVPMKAYYDGSADAKKERAITLTGVAAPESVWDLFEPAWQEVLDGERFSVKALHMADLMGFYGEFKNWDIPRRRDFLEALWNVVGGLRQQHLIAYSCTVILPDWRRRKAELPSLRSPQSICVNYCVGGLHLARECADEPHPIILYFDRTEAFMHKVNRVWLRRRKQHGTFFRQIRNIIPVDDTERPVQLADMLAWIANSEALNKDYPERLSFGFSSALMIEHCREVFDYSRIVLRYSNGQLATDGTDQAQ